MPMSMYRVLFIDKENLSFPIYKIGIKVFNLGCSKYTPMACLGRTLFWLHKWEVPP